MRTRFLQAAQLELVEAVAAYNIIRPGLGGELRDEVNAALDRIEFWPHAWSRAPRNALACVGPSVSDTSLSMYLLSKK